MLSSCAPLPTTSRFSPRERQIIGAVLEAKAVKDIALELELSVNTIKDYLKSIYRKARVHSARELMLLLGAPANSRPDPDLAQFLQAAHVLAQEAGAGGAEILSQLSAAVRRCTRAQRVSYWRLLRGPRETVLANDAGGPALQCGPFVRRLTEHGWARFEPAEEGSCNLRNLAAAGLRGPVLGAQCAPTPRVQFLLASEPCDGDFAALDLPALRLLARLASQAGQRQHYFAAIA